MGVFLVPRAARAEDAEVQDIYRKEQGTKQLEQVQMLESILRRVVRLEASERTSTQYKTSISDPPPERTDRSQVNHASCV